MKRFHLVFGLLAVVGFILTGQYMDLKFNHLQGMEIGMRLLYRTRHIFILMAGLLNVVLGVYWIPRDAGWRRWLQWSGSGLLIVATLLFFTGFYLEPPVLNLQTPFSHWGTYLMLAGTLFHLFAGGRPANTPSASG